MHHMCIKFMDPLAKDAFSRYTVLRVSSTSHLTEDESYTACTSNIPKLDGLTLSQVTLEQRSAKRTVRMCRMNDKAPYSYYAEVDYTYDAMIFKFDSNVCFEYTVKWINARKGGNSKASAPHFGELSVQVLRVWDRNFPLPPSSKPKDSRSSTICVPG